MRIIILGGAGDMGSRAAEDLAKNSDVESLTIADRNIEAAQRVSQSVSGLKAKVTARQVDAMDHPSLVSAMADHDVAASALGPFFLFESRMVRAAIEAKTDYCSICDEWQPAEAVIDEFDEAARQKKVNIVTCLGASPGLTNMSAAFLARQTENVERIRISVYLPLNCGGGAAALRHGLHIMTGSVVHHRNGFRQKLKACSENRLIEFPGSGYIHLWNMGHAEPATLPRTFRSVKDVDFYMGFGKGTELILSLAKRGAFDGKRRANTFVKVFDTIEKRISKKSVGTGALRVDVWGKKNDKTEHLLHCGRGEMRDITGLSLSVGALMLGRGQMTNKDGGVFAPEACLDPEIFLRELRERGVIAYKDLAMTSPVF